MKRPTEPKLKCFKRARSRNVSDPIAMLKEILTNQINYFITKGLVRVQEVTPAFTRIYLNTAKTAWKPEEEEIVESLKDAVREVAELEKLRDTGKLDLNTAMVRAYRLGVRFDSHQYVLLDPDLALGIAHNKGQGWRKGGKRSAQTYASREEQLRRFFQPLVDAAYHDGVPDHIRRCQKAAKYYNDHRKDPKMAHFVKIVDIGRRREGAPVSAHTVRNWVVPTRQNTKS